MTLYIWWLFTIPTDRLVCELWTRNVPTQAEIVQSCGTADLGPYTLQVTRGGVTVCTIPAPSLPWFMQDCTLSGRMDDYRLRVVEPMYQTLICSVSTPTQDAPTADEIAAQCPGAAKYEIRFSGTRQADPKPDTVCMPPPTPRPDTIATSKDLHLLAGKLIWYGRARSNCPGGLAGVDPETFAATACGMDGARADVIAWQNSLDDAILQASAAWNVPPMTLKNIIERETQYWPWTGSLGEHGMIQITDDGAHIVLHVYEKGYYQLRPEQRAQARAAWLASLDCYYCSPEQAIQKARESMSKYAQALAAYYCTYQNWPAALTAWNVKYKE